MGADSYPDLLERLFAEFEDRQPLAVIETVVNQCHHELDGQTPAGAHFELLERLARLRLTDLNPPLQAHGGSGD